MDRWVQARRTVAVLVIGMAASTALVACGSDDETAAAPATSSPTAAAPITPAPTQPEPNPAESGDSQPAVPEILDFSGETVAGDSFSGSSVAGKPVVLWFWAPWCAVCRSQAPQVESLAAEYGDDLAVIGIGSLDSGSAIAGFAEDVAGPTHLSDPEGELWKRFRISEQSSFVVLDAEGNEVLRTGYNDDDELSAAVEKLVG